MCGEQTQECQREKVVIATLNAAAMILSDFILEPEHIEVMREAFHRVCDVLQLDCGRDDLLAEIVVIKIAESMKSGERDPIQVSERVLAELKASPHGAEAA